MRISPVEGSMATAAPTLPRMSSSPSSCSRASIVLTSVLPGTGSES